MEPRHAVVIEHFTEVPEMWVANCTTCGWRGKLTSRPITAKAAAHTHEHVRFGWRAAGDDAAAFDADHPANQRIVDRGATWSP